MSEFVHSGRRLIANRKFQEAVKVCRLGLLKDPSCLEGRLVLAQALMSLARYDEVLAEARAALELEPTTAQATILLGEALFFKGAYAQARDALRQAALQAPEDEKVQRLLAELEATAQAGLEMDYTGELGDCTRSYPTAEEPDPNLVAVGDATEIQQAPPVMDAHESGASPLEESAAGASPARADASPPLTPPRPVDAPDAAYAERPLPVSGEVQVTEYAEPSPDAPGASVDVSHPDIQASVETVAAVAPRTAPEAKKTVPAPMTPPRPASPVPSDSGGTPDPREGSKPGQRWAERRWLRTEDAQTREALLVPSPNVDTAEVRESDLFPRPPDAETTAQALRLLRHSTGNTPPEIVDREAATAHIRVDPPAASGAPAPSFAEDPQAGVVTDPAADPWNDENEETVPRPAVDAARLAGLPLGRQEPPRSSPVAPPGPRPGLPTPVAPVGGPQAGHAAPLRPPGGAAPGDLPRPSWQAPLPSSGPGAPLADGLRPDMRGAAPGPVAPPGAPSPGRLPAPEAGPGRPAAAPGAPPLGPRPPQPGAPAPWPGPHAPVSRPGASGSFAPPAAAPPPPRPGYQPLGVALPPLGPGGPTAGPPGPAPPSRLPPLGGGASPAQAAAPPGGAAPHPPGPRPLPGAGPAPPGPMARPAAAGPKPQGALPGAQAPGRRPPGRRTRGGRSDAPGRETTAKTRRPRAPWLRRYWKLLAAATAVTVVVVVVILIRAASRQSQRSEELRKLHQEGVALMTDGRYESLRRAEEVFRRLLRRSPTHPGARQARLFVVAALAVEFGDGLERAADLLDRRDEGEGDLSDAGRCLVALAADKRERAAEEVQGAARRHPRSPWVAYARAWVARYSDAPDKALTALAGVEEGNAKILLLRIRAEAMLDLERPKEVETLLASLPEGQAKAPWATLLRLRTRLADESRIPSLPELDDALSLTNDRRGRVSPLQRRMAHLLLGEAYARLGKDADQRTHTEHGVAGPEIHDPTLADVLTSHLVRLGDMKRAEALAAAALRHFPARRALIFALATGALSRGHPQEALEALAPVPPDRRTTLTALVQAQAALALDRTEEARRLLEPLRRERSDLLSVRLTWARLLIRDRRFDKALAELEEVLKRSPRNVEAIQEAARLELAQGKAANAILRLEVAMRFKPGDPQLRADLVEAHLAAHDWKSAENTLSAALASFPTNPAVLTAHGRSLLLKGQMDEAADAFRKALEQDPRRLSAATGLAEAVLIQPKLTEAEAAVAKVEALSPRRGRLYRGWLLFERWDVKRGDPKAAARILAQEATEAGEPGRTAAMLLIEVHAKRGHKRAAELELKRQRKRHGERPELLVAYGLALVEADANDAALSTLGKALGASQGLDVHPTILAKLHARIAQAKWQAGDFSAARRSAEQALGLWPGCGLATTMLGIVDYERAQFRSARQNLRKAVEKDPTLALAYHYLGLVELQLGERAAGNKALERSLELRPKGPLADEARRALRR